MRSRHKQPTLVSMWMLDVFCCALGCVTLLFFIHAKQSNERADASKERLLDLETKEKKLAAALSDLEAAMIRLNSAEAGREELSVKLKESEGKRLQLVDQAEDLGKELAAVLLEKDDLAKALARTQSEADTAKALAESAQTALKTLEAKAGANAKELALARIEAMKAEDALRKKQKDSESLAADLTKATTAAADLARLLRKRDEERLVLAKQVDDLKKQLDDLDAKVLAARKERDDAEAMAKKTANELATMKAASTDAADLKEKLSDANATIIDLQGDKAKLADKYDRLQKDQEARFAGIVTTGKRVVFLVDLSGSMAKSDTETADPTKWPIVVDTVARVMRSVVGLEKYQVIVFSNEARWLFGGGEWQDYSGEQSVERVKRALLDQKPYGDTNLYTGLETAFSLRNPGGLDTIYLFSDGLPTSGPGLTVAQQNANPPLKEIERSEILGKHIRKTLDETWNRPMVGKERVKIHAVGFFFESPDVGAFLWALVRENAGSFVGMSRP